MSKNDIRQNFPFSFKETKTAIYIVDTRLNRLREANITNTHDKCLMAKQVKFP